MTEETKRAVAAIAPIAEVLGVNVKVYDNILYLNGQMIAIAENSQKQTVMEFLGFVFINIFCKEKLLQIRGDAKERITRYWIK